jgi:plastocyanin/predicted small secreted protein
MKKGRIAFAAILAVLLLACIVMSGCDNAFAGKAAALFASNSSDTSNGADNASSITTTTRDELTLRFNKIMYDEDSDESKETIVVTTTGGSATTTSSTSSTSTSSTLPIHLLTTTTLNPMATTTSTTATSTTTTLPNDGLTVIIKDSKISPVELYIKTGETVRWVNREAKRVHMVSSISTQEFRSPRMAQGDTFEHTFNSPGTYGYYDVIDPEKIKGKIIVS